MVDVGIACAGLNARSPQPIKKKADETDENYLQRFDRWMVKCNQQLTEQQTLQSERLREFRSFLDRNDGEIKSNISKSAVLPDSVSCRIQIPGKGLKDLALNFPYLFEITEAEKPVSTSKESNENGLSLQQQSIASKLDNIFAIHSLPQTTFPPNALDEIIGLNHKQKIFFHLPTAAIPYHDVHMGAWATAIDHLTFQNDILFIVPAGNVSAFGQANSEEISESDPTDPSRQIASPAQSLQALTVGSVSASIAQQTTVATVPTRKPGIWDTIKPEVVEQQDELGHADFQVCKIADALVTAYPAESCLLHRALIVHSASWSNFSWAKDVRPAEALRRAGYGVPNLERAIGNSCDRVTYFTQGEQTIKARQAHIYQVSLPPLPDSNSNDLEVLVEVTLAYKARSARTHRGRSEYLSTWLDWQSNRQGEEPERFLHRILKDYDALAETEAETTNFKWAIGTQKRYSRDTQELLRFSRSSGTVQKDWATVKLSDLGTTFCLAAVGHQGWDSSLDASAVYTLVISFEAIDSEFDLYSLMAVPRQEFVENLSDYPNREAER